LPDPLDHERLGASAQGGGGAEELLGCSYGSALLVEGCLGSEQRSPGFRKLGGCFDPYRAPLLCDLLEGRNTSGHAAQVESHLTVRLRELLRGLELLRVAGPVAQLVPAELDTLGHKVQLVRIVHEMSAVRTMTGRSMAAFV
jgi:hypothetical protein